MLALSLLLSAAVGVNAIGGGDIEAIRISDKEFICAGDCAFRRVFFGQSGYFCPEAEAIVRVNKHGNLDDEWSGTPFQCAGEELVDGISARQRFNGEKPRNCIVEQTTDSKFLACNSKKGGGAAKTVEWSDIEKELKLATENKPAPEEAKSKTKKKRAQEGRNKCGKAAQEVHSMCTKTGESQECEEKSREFMKSCLNAQ